MGIENMGHQNGNGDLEGLESLNGIPAEERLKTFMGCGLDRTEAIKRMRAEQKTKITDQEKRAERVMHELGRNKKTIEKETGGLAENTADHIGENI